MIEWSRVCGQGFLVLSPLLSPLLCTSYLPTQAYYGRYDHHFDLVMHWRSVFQYKVHFSTDILSRTECLLFKLIPEFNMVNWAHCIHHFYRFRSCSFPIVAQRQRYGGLRLFQDIFLFDAVTPYKGCGFSGAFVMFWVPVPNTFYRSGRSWKDSNTFRLEPIRLQKTTATDCL